MDIFPITVAVGKAFCNRIEERKQLKNYVTNGRHSVLIAPRRYGKTSLIYQSLVELKLPFTIIELTLATSVNDVEKIIINHVSELLYKILPRTIKTKQAILKLFKWLNPELVLTAGGQKLQFKPDWKSSDTINNIAEILIKLDKAAILANKKIVVVMDEFQQLNEIADHAIEATIRHAMQYSKQVSYIFSGSHRHMLLSMFNSKNRPFYNSCEILQIERISSDEYVPFIQNAAKEKWASKLRPETLATIFDLTELHPSYINRICGYFWLTNEIPEKNSVNKYWQYFVQSKRGEFAEELLNLSNNQKRVIKYLAKNPTAHPSDSTVCHVVNLSEASIRQAVKVLLKKDYLYKDKNGMLKVLDPALKSYINSL